ncbi:hypothetical protein TNCT_511311 [Trichonephila clavata]|uniref:Uncharacterized protein n=1 Tax=Trichonephila clavata TaxID=2740835 RepID=A0A8X6IEP4_TRICU|nr:hypothetical protein TNCT_511311 [Trichonephila clavata]
MSKLSANPSNSKAFNHRNRSLNLILFLFVVPKPFKQLSLSTMKLVEPQQEPLFQGKPSEEPSKKLGTIGNYHVYSRVNKYDKSSFCIKELFNFTVAKLICLLRMIKIKEWNWLIKFLSEKFSSKGKLDVFESPSSLAE